MSPHGIVTALAAGLLTGMLVITPAAVWGSCPAHDTGSGVELERRVAPPSVPERQGTAKTDASPTNTPPTALPGPQKAVAPPLDLAGLEKRLRATKAIGVFTKLSLKNQVDDLVEQFKAFHQGRSEATLAELRERYNLLMLKVLSLLQSNDPSLARDLTASREAIWAVLTDPVKFSNVTRGG